MSENLEVERIAAGLTKAQRAAILWCHADGLSRQHERGAPSRTSFYCLLSIVKGDPTKGIARHYKLTVKGSGTTPNGRIWPEDTWALTPLGLAVRAYLLSEKSHV